MPKRRTKRPIPASITKVMTALLVLEAIDSGKLKKDQQITAGPTTLQDMSPKASTANLKPGDTLTVEQLLYCLLLPSANEAGNILAVAVDGSIEAFVEHMNTRQQSWAARAPTLSIPTVSTTRTTTPPPMTSPCT